MGSPLEIVAVLLLLACVYLAVVQSVWTWPLGLVAVTLTGILMFQERLYAEVVLQSGYFVFNVYGWYEWLYGGENKMELKVSRTPRALLIGLLVLAAAVGLGAGAWLAANTDAAAPYLDSTLVAYSFVAQFLMTRKWIENWHIWITVDVAYVYLFLTRSLYWFVGLYAIFIVLATMGLIEWKRSYDAEHSPPPAVPDAVTEA